MGPNTTAEDNRRSMLAKYENAYDKACDQNLSYFDRFMSCYRAERIADEIALRDSTFDWNY